MSSTASSLADATSSDAALRRFLHGLPGVDQVGAEQRAAGLGTRSIKTSAKEYALDLAIRMVDLTTLEGSDTPGKVRALCLQGDAPRPRRPDLPAGRGRLRLPRHGRRRQGDPRRLRGARRLGGHRLPQRSCGAGHQARRRRGRRRRRRRRDRHGDRPGRVPVRALPRGLRGDRGRRARPAATRAPEGDLRDRRAADLRQRTTRQLAGDDGRRRTSSRPPPARSSRPPPCP